MSIRSIIRSCISSRKSSLNSEDPYFVQKLLFTEKKDLVIFDVGAYIGSVTATYKKIFPHATIYCFEPFPNSFNELNRLAKTKSIIPYQIALSNQKGKTKLMVNTDQSCNSMFPRPTTGVKYYSERSKSTGQIEIETQTLDNFCEKEDISKIDILKLDVEGAELKVLKGATQKLMDNRIKLIFTEVMFVAHYEGGCLFHEVSYFLSSCHYQLFNLYDLKRARNGQLRWGNAIFMNPQMRDRIESFYA